MNVPLFQVDAFASAAFTGNPAAVCILETEADSDWMQQVAQEMNLSETAFVVPGESTYGLRWFTPGAEVDLCGHATLASAHILWETGRPSSWPIEFETLSGRLTATSVGDRIQLDFPADAPAETSPPEGLERALGARIAHVGAGQGYLLVEVADEIVLRRLEPDFALLAAATPGGVCVTTRSENSAYDFVSRFFAPGLGVDEDPVTGSAHCLLGPFWGERLGKEELVGFQASERGGAVIVRNRGERVLLEGTAVTVLRGELLVPPK